MSVFNESFSIKLKEVCSSSFNQASLSVAARPYHALVLRVSGHASFFDGTRQAETNKGDIFYMPAGCRYHAEYSAGTSIIVVHFYSDTVFDMENHMPANPDLISSIFHQMYEIWNKKPEGYYYKTLALFCEVFENISADRNLALCSNTKKAFENAVSYMEKHYLSPDFGIEKMVSVSHMSNTRFRELFLSRFGMTPVKYLTAKRLSHAEKLLMTGKYTIAEVSEMSGFCDVKYFSRVVKKAFGVPPSKLYRHS